MNKVKFAGAALILSMLAMGVLAGVSYAQNAVRSARDGQQGAKVRPGRGGRAMGMGLRGLDLTDAQKTQLKALHEQSAASARTYREQLKPLREQMRALTQSGNFDEGAVRALALQQAQLAAELQVIHARTQAAVFNMLTPEQKAKRAEQGQRGLGKRGGGRRFGR